MFFSFTFGLFQQEILATVEGPTGGEIICLARQLVDKLGPGKAVLNLEGDGTANLFAYARVPVLAGLDPDPAVDALQHEIESLVGARLTASRSAVFQEVARAAASRVPRAAPPEWHLRARAAVPFLEEPWYC